MVGDYKVCIDEATAFLNVAKSFNMESPPILRVHDWGDISVYSHPVFYALFLFSNRFISSITAAATTISAANAPYCASVMCEK